MLTKKADFAFTDVHAVNISDINTQGVLMRTASANRIIIEPGSEKSKIIEAEVKKHPNALFFRAKAIEANKANTNGDYFSEEELLKSYKSFEGVPFFTNHNNQNIENARGKLIHAEWIPEEKAVYVIAFVDRDAYPDICRGIEHEYVTGTSMGCSVEYSTCNICNNRAEKTEQYCHHIKERKGRKFTGTARDVITGEKRTFKDEPVFEYNFGLKFIELSAVVDPACPSCHIQGIISNNDYLAKVAQLENDLFMVKTAAIEKKASQEEIQQIDGVLQTLETIAVSLIKNRKQVEMEFASDLVDILSQLQTWMDELVGAGYGNLPNAPVPGTVGNAPEGTPAPQGGVPTPPPVDQAGASVTPMSSESPVGSPSVSGAPGKPLVQGPKLPITTPIKPRAADTSDNRTIQRIADISCTSKYIPNIEKRDITGNEIIRKASILCGNLNKSGDIDMGKRRTITAKHQEKNKVMEILSSSWKEKQDFFEYIKQMPSIQDNDNRVVINKRDDSFIVVGESKSNPDNKIVWTYEDLTDDDKKMIQASPQDASVKFLELFSEKSNKQKEGEKIMTDISKNAGATTVNPVPQEVQEAQLRQKGLYHSRTETEQNQVTQAQLEKSRKGEKDYLTEKQLNDPELKLNPRTDEEAQEVQEAQLKPLREDNDRNTITQDQLKSQRKDSEPEVITQKQLDDLSAPWARTADRDPTLFKSAADHMKSVINVLAESVMSAGCTPEEVCEVAASLVDSTKNRVYLASSILAISDDKESINYGKRIAFWNNKNLKVASTGKKEIAQLVVDGLRKVASDKSINPDILIEAVDVISEGIEGITGVTKRIEEKVAESNSSKISQVSRKSELRAALKTETLPTKEERDSQRDSILESAISQDSKMRRETERKSWEKVINKEAAKDASYMIETSFGESNLKKNDPSFKSGIVSFARGALASQNLKLAAVTNVTISGDTIQIAVQTDEGEQEVQIPVGDDSAPSMDETIPEGDMSGEGLEGSLSTPPTPPAPAPASAPTAMASNKSGKKMSKVAQAPMGGGMPGASGGAPGGAPEQGLPGPAPDGDAIQSLTQDTPEDAAAEGAEDVPTVGEQQMPWTICPECGSADADVSNEEGNINGKCNKCSAEWEGLIQKNIQFKITKPTVSVGKPAGAEGEGAPEAPAETPEVPSLPVAAQTRIDKGSIVRIAENKKQYGHVCPACGQKKCKTSSNSNGHSEYVCPSCKTEVVKDIMISANDPSKSYMRVRWDIKPNTGCKGCSEEVAKFASKIKVSQMLRTAAANKDSFPMANCIERMARQYGGNTVATFGPCKGKLVADCVCKDLQRLGFSKIKDMVRLANASMQKDPMDECLEEQQKKGHKVKEAKHICNCLKKKFASELADNIYAHAFGNDIVDGKEDRISSKDLTTLYVLAKEEELEVAKAKIAAEEAAADVDIGTALPPLKEAEVEVEIVKEAGKKTSKAKSETVVKEAKGFFCDKCKKPCKVCECPKDGGDDKDKSKDSDSDEGESDENKKEAMAMNGQRIRSVNEEVFNMASVKTASTPTKVESIEGNVEAGVPRKQAYMGEEAKADSMINKTPKKPEVPRKDAYMGKEREADSMINADLKLPDVAVNSSYMGKEREVQKGMPAINNEIKGTVIADSVELTIKDGKISHVAKQMKEVDTVEKDVEAGVPRSDAKMGEESKAEGHINAPNKGPDVPRSDAYMGKEKEADSMINEKLSGPDVPIDNAYMGHEKEVQKDMPGINDEMLKQVRMQREDQMNKIAAAREKQATKVASWLVGNGRIPNDLEAFEATVKALSAFEIDKIVQVASVLFPSRTVKTAATSTHEVKTASDSHSIPAIIMESKKSDDSSDFVKKLAGAFTVGNTKFDHDLTVYGERSK